DPDPQRLVMAGENGPGQVIEMFLTGLALIAPALGLGRIVPCLEIATESQWGQVTPSGHRNSRTVSKHFRSSMRFWMLTTVRDVAILTKGACMEPGKGADEEGFYALRGRSNRTAWNPG